MTIFENEWTSKNGCPFSKYTKNVIVCFSYLLQQLEYLFFSLFFFCIENSIHEKIINNCHPPLLSKNLSETRGNIHMRIFHTL